MHFLPSKWKTDLVNFIVFFHTYNFLSQILHMICHRLYHRNWLKRIFHQPKYFIRLVEGHHYINRLVDVFESTTFIFLVFELCQNIDLFDYLSEHVSLSEKRCRAIMKQIFEAVYHCHKVISKDMKKESSLKKVNLNISESY